MPTAITLNQNLIEDHIALYRELHSHPELSMQEELTAQLIESRLEKLGAEPQRCGGTGVVGVIQNGEGPVVAFRADIDGLPLQEQTDKPYASTDTGALPDGTEVPVMHACGHDSHAAAALSMAAHMAAHKDMWSGTLVMVFQPGEETASGSAAMVADGIWDRFPNPELLLGQHLSPLPEGHIQTRAGHAMAFADSWKVTVKGVGAHGSQPHRSVDPIVQAAFMITRLQTVVSREVNPLTPAVVTVGTISGGLKENIIAPEATFTLNVRTVDEVSRSEVLDRILRILKAEAEASGASEPVIEKLYRFPRCYNDPAATGPVVRALAEELGMDAVNGDAPLRMGSEDVGRLADTIGVPMVFWWFGGHDPEDFEDDQSPAANHSPHFAPNDLRVVRAGTRAALAAVLSRLAKTV